MLKENTSIDDKQQRVAPLGLDSSIQLDKKEPPEIIAER